MLRNFPKPAITHTLRGLALLMTLTLGLAAPCAAQGAPSPQTRLRQGLHEAQQGHMSEAMAIFGELAKEHPELPEPLLHLATTYRASGLLEQAYGTATVLKLNHPGYAPAYELLGELQLEMARRSFAEYGRQGGREAATLQKRAAIEQLSRPHGATGSVQRSAASGRVAVEPAAPASAAVALSAAPSAGDASPSEQAQLENSVRAWAQAWSKRDVTAYLAAYSPGFESPAGTSRANWELERRARIQSKARIAVTVEELRIEVKGEQATASFRQNYRGDALNLLSRKVLTLHKQGPRWLILREAVAEESRG